MKYDAEIAAAIAHWAPQLGVALTPALVHAVIQKESSHVKLVTDEAGGHHSYGPMMVYDTTAIKYGIADPTTLQNPALGIWYGVRNLAEMLHTFRGDVPAAVSAYNTGPAHAKRNAAGKFPNQPYVDAVLSFWNSYKGKAVAGGGAILAIVGGLLIARSLRKRRAA